MTQHRHKDSRGLWTTYAIDPSGFATKADLDALAARVAALEPTAPPPTTGKSILFAGTAPQLNALVADQTIDIINFAPKTYSGFSSYIRQQRTRPLRINMGPGVIFDGGTAGVFHLGTLNGSTAIPMPGVPTAPTTDITLDFTGSVIQNYRLGQDGIIQTGWVERLTFIHPTIRTTTGITGGGGNYNQSHALYCESDQNHRSVDIKAIDWDVSANKTINGVQTYHNPCVNGLLVKGGTWLGLNRFALLYGDALNITVDGATITNCNATIDAANSPTTGDQAAGVIKNTHATGSGPLAPGLGLWYSTKLLDGGGNTSS